MIHVPPRLALAGASPLVRAGRPLGRAFTRDSMFTYDASTIDSTGSFLVGELERLDLTLNQPLYNITWSRDVDLREDVSIADELASWTNSSFAALGGINPAGKAWIGKDTNAIAGVALDVGKTAQPLFLWAMELSYTIPELESSIKLGRPVDAQKFEAIQAKDQMDIDEQVYIGDSYLGVTGLLNSPAVPVSNVVNGVSGTPGFTTKTEDELLRDINAVLTSSWAASGWAAVPDQLRLPPNQFAALVARRLPNTGESVISYLGRSSIAMAQNGRPLNIQPLKWLVGRGVGGTDRMFAYSKNKRFVQFPLVPLQRTPLEYRSIYHLTTYFGRKGVVEWRYPETAAYVDGI